MADKLTLDRIAMKDRSTSHLRIYVGNLTESATVEELYEHFKKYGQINGIVTNRGFGFIQFESEESAQESINKANGSHFQGKALTVRTAQTSNKPVETVVIHPDKPYAVALHDNTPLVTDDGGDDVYDRDGNYIGDKGEQDSFEDGFPKRERVRRRGRGGRGRGALGFRERSPLGRGSDWVDRAYERFAAAPPRALPMHERNDCEIIVVSKTLTEYAEYIEGRLKRLGIVVDLLFPMEDVPIGKVLGNIASRGCLYAILVMPVNQERRSLTLTILHGLPQEHRNMPIEDALSLLSRNFEEVRRGGAAGREAVYALLGQLADGRALTALQYDKVIEYLKERREQQVKVELGEPLATPATNKAQTELQQRILSILNEKTAPAPPPEPAPTPVPAPPEENKLLNDPSVRKALDSILQKFV